jgi:hypothetical protein
MIVIAACTGGNKPAENKVKSKDSTLIKDKETTDNLVDPTGTYSFNVGDTWGELKILYMGGEKPIKFSLQAGKGPNTGELSGELISQEDGTLIYIEEACQLIFALKELTFDVSYKEGACNCGAGLNVSFERDYKRVSKAKPVFD